MSESEDVIDDFVTICEESDLTAVIKCQPCQHELAHIWLPMDEIENLRESCSSVK